MFVTIQYLLRLKVEGGKWKVDNAETFRYSNTNAFEGGRWLVQLSNWTIFNLTTLMR